jgi:NAD dependent epimerase/dehydratase family enzyme
VVPAYTKWFQAIMPASGELPKDLRLRVKGDSISLEKWDKDKDKDICNTRLKVTNFFSNF